MCPLSASSRAALAAAMLLALSAATAFGEEPEAPEVKPPGLPAGIDWTFNFDATWGTFGFSNSLYENPKPDDPSGNLSDNWSEGSVKPAISGVYALGDSSQIYGKASVVGERTYNAPPPTVGGSANSFDVEDLYIGWRSGNSLSSLGEDALDVTVGSTQYKIGHGMLLWDGASEGGSRGGYWTNARKAWKFAIVGRLKTGGNTLEVFHLERNELPESLNQNRIDGVNYEYAIGEDTTLGATYLYWKANQYEPQRNGMHVYDLRAYTAPIPNFKQLSFEFEYAKESNGNALDSYAWNALVAYKFDAPWQPKLSYRYAFFEGDNPNTAKNEGFDGLATGFYDWGTWWQGEIAGEYFLSNSNLISQQVRLHTTPIESLGTGLIFYDFKFQRPDALGPAVTSQQAAHEVDWYADWSVNKHLILSFVAAWAEPNKGAEQAYGRTSDFTYGMVFAAYSF